MTYRKPHNDAGHIILQVIGKNNKVLATWSFGPKKMSLNMILGNPVDGSQTKDIDKYLNNPDYEFESETLVEYGDRLIIGNNC